MPNTTSEEDKKHGDKLQSLIDRTGSSSPPEKGIGAEDDALVASQDDENEDEDNEDAEEEEEEEEDDDDEDVQPDAAEDRGTSER